MIHTCDHGNGLTHTCECARKGSHFANQYKSKVADINRMINEKKDEESREEI